MKKKYGYLVSNLITYLATGILQADMYYANYELPPGFDTVIKDANIWFSKYWPSSGLEGWLEFEDKGKLEQLIKNFIHNHQICQMWNNWDNPGPFEFTSRYDAPKIKREFIDLDAIVRNVMNNINKADEADMRFETEFRTKYPNDIIPPSV